MNIEFQLRGWLAEDYWTIRVTKGKTEATLHLLTLLGQPPSGLVTLVSRDFVLLMQQSDTDASIR